MSTPRIVALLALASVLALMAGGPASAGSYYLSINASAGDLAFNNFNQTTSGGTVTAGGGSLTDTGGLSVHGEFSAVVTAASSVNIGSYVAGLSVFPKVNLHLAALASYMDEGAGDLESVGATASLSYSDQLQVSVLPIDIVGIASLTALARIGVTGNVIGDGSLSLAYNGGSMILTQQYTETTITAQFPISFGEGSLLSTTIPISITARDTATANLAEPSTVVDFKDSISLLGFELVDQNGDYVPATFTSDEGFNYADVGALPAAAVPEPSLLLLCGVAGLGLLTWRWARRAGLGRAVSAG